jgi:hypothetical protein
MNVVRQNDGSGTRVSYDPIGDRYRAGALPIEWIDIPHNDFVAKFFVDPFLLPRGNGSIRRPQQSGPISRRAVNRVIGFLQFTPHGFVGHFSESWMRPTVIADFMTLASGAGDNLRMVGNVLADHKKGCLDVVRAQKIEKFRCKLRAGAIVESQGNVWSIDMYPTEGERCIDRQGSLVFL